MAKAKRTTLPGLTSFIEDYGLGVGPEPRVSNDSILIVGTSTDGPMYEPIPIQSKDHAQLIFGSFGNGTLVKGVFEAIDATIEGTPDIRGMRIGNGEKASLEINERTSTSSTWDAQTTDQNSLKLEALYPGSKYNAVSIFLNEDRKISVYNPKTGEYTNITYDDTNPNNTNVDCRNVKELVETINNDANLGSVILASTSGIQAQFEIQVNAGSTGISTVNSKTVVKLKDVLSGYAVATPGTVLPTGYLWDATVAATAGNLMDELQEVFSISISNPILLETKGLTTITTELTPFDGKGDSRFSSIQALDDYNSDNYWQHAPSGTSTVVSEYMNYLDREVFTDVTTSGGALSQAFAGLLMAPDDSYEPRVSGTLYTASSYALPANYLNACMSITWALANSGTIYPTGTYLGDSVSGVYATQDDFVNITALGNASGYLANPGQIIIECSDTGGASDSEWQQLFYHPVSGIWISGFAVNTGTGTITLQIGSNASGYTGTNNLTDAGFIYSSTNVAKADKYIRISCNTCKGFLSEVESIPSLQAASSDWTSYFVMGNEVKFSATVPTDIIVNHGVKVNYEPGDTVTVTDADDAEIKFPGSTQPGAGGNALDATNTSIIGLKYKYLPQFPAITTTAQSLEGGTDGTVLSSAVLYDEFTTAYGYLEDYAVQIVVPMGAYLDATKKGYNSVTGLEETVNAQYQVQFDTFLDTVSTNVNETNGVIGVTPASGTTLASIKDWVDRLTIQDLSDSNRGANIMPLLSSRYISVSAFEPVFDNLGGLPYTSNGQAAYAGMISSLPPQQAPTNKSIPNALRTRFDLSTRQLERLSAMRYVSMRKKPGKNPVICDAMTAAPTGSDFVRLTTVRITFAAMDVVRAVCDPFIGQPNTASKLNAMEAAITKGLNGMVDAGALKKFAFTISSSPTQRVLGVVDVELILVPIFEIRRIRTTVKLRTEIPA
jgi:hypothetical protein